MNIVFLTAEERLYYPAFFHRVLSERAADTLAIFTCPLKLGRQNTLQTINKYRVAFGWTNLMKLVEREIKAHLCDLFKIGRTRQRFYSIAAVAAHHGVHCETIPNVNAESFLQRLREMQTELIVSVGCPQIFRKPLIDLPPRGCLNVHGSLLPKYRGLAPSFWMMHDGETEAGVTVFFVNEAIDLGDALEVEAFPILPEETLEQFIVRSKRIAADVLLRAIARIEAGDFETKPLNQADGSYYSFPSRAAYREFRRRGRRIW